MNTAIHRRLATVATVTMLVVACGTTTAPSDGLTRAGQNKLVLTIVTGEDNPEEAAWFAKAVAEESAGAIEVKIDNRSVPTGPTYEQDIIKYVAAGKAQLGFSGARSFDSLGVTSFVGLHAPFLVEQLRARGADPSLRLGAGAPPAVLGPPASSASVTSRDRCDSRLASPATWSSCPTTRVPGSAFDRPL